MRSESLRDLLIQAPSRDAGWNMENIPATAASLASQIAMADPAGWTAPNLSAAVQFARLRAIQGEMTEAKNLLERCTLELQKMTGPEKPHLEIRVNLETGRLQCFQNIPSRALPFFSQAWDQALRCGSNFYAIDAAVMLAINVPLKDRGVWLQKALQLAESAPPDESQDWFPHLDLMDGWRQFDLHRYHEALQCFRRAEERPRLRERAALARSVRWASGCALRALGKFPEALAIQRALLEELQSEGRENGNVYLEIAENMRLQHEHEEARPYFGSAHRALSAQTWYSDNRSSELERMNRLSKKR